MDRRQAVPLLALGCCAVGLLGLYLPLVVARVDPRVPIPHVADLLAGLDLSIAGTPVGFLFVGAFVLLSALPVLDLVRRRLDGTAALAIPAAFGLFPAFWLAMVAMKVADWAFVLHVLLPAGLVDVRVGSGAVLLILAEIGLLVASVAALFGRFRPGAGTASVTAPDPSPLPGPPRNPHL